MELQGAAMYAQQAGAYMGAAKASVGIGKGNAKSIRLAAAQLDRYEQLNLREATMQAKRRIGQGRTGFAANGVLVDSGSAAMWEQDEAADAALERLDIMQQYEDKSWSYLMQANKAEAEGYQNAAGYAAQAAGQAGAAMQAAGSAYASRLQASAARAAAARAKKKKWGGVIGTVAGAAVGAVGAALAPATFGASMVATGLAGSAIGGAAGNVADTL